MTTSSGTRVRLSIALDRNVRTAPLLDGRISPEGISLNSSGVHPSEMFWRQLRFADFDVSEMSLASLLIMKDRSKSEKLDWVGLPIFTTRRFFHTRVLVRSDANIERPSDLRGKRVGVPEYQQTAAVWCRGIFSEHFGLDPCDVRWFMERPPKLSHSYSTGFEPPAGISLDYVDHSSSLATMLLSGELDATLLYLPDRNLVDRSDYDLRNERNIRTLFPDPIGEGRRYYSQTGIFPINHIVVVKRAVAEEYPWVVLNLMGAFIAARDLAYSEARSLWDEFHPPEITNTVLDSFPIHAFRYGLSSNYAEVDALVGYVQEQGLTSRKVDIGEIVDRRTVDL